MPLFYFDTDIGDTDVDLHGVELADIDAARHLAAERAETALRNATALSSGWRIRVSDESGFPLFSLNAWAGNNGLAGWPGDLTPDQLQSRN